MRVAYLTHFIPHYRKEIFINLTKNLRGEFYVYASSKPKLAFSLLDNNTPNIIFIESEINSIKLFKKNVYFQTDILKKLLINEFDIYMLSLNPSDLTIWLALIFAKIFKRKIILWGHGYKPYQRNTYSLIRKMMVRLSTASIFYSKSAVDYYIKFIKPEKLYYSNNAVNTQEIIEIKKNISYEIVKVNPPENCEYWQDSTIIAPIVKK